MGNAFKKLRQQYLVDGKPISQRKLEPLLGVAATHICELESGRMPSLNELKRYHEFFRVSYEFLLGETEDYVSTDIFRKKPSTESKLQNTIRWLMETQKEDEVKLREMTNFLLTTNQGLALMFYLSEYKANRIDKMRLRDIFEELFSEKLQKLSYAEIRMIFDGEEKRELFEN